MRGGRAPGPAAGRPGPSRRSARAALMRRLPRRPPRAAATTTSRRSGGAPRRRRRRRPSSSSASASPPHGSTSRSQPRCVRAGHAASTRRGGRRRPPPASWRTSTVTGSRRRVRRQPAGQLADVDAGRDVVGAGPRRPAGLALDPGEPEHPLLAAVGVEPDDVPAPGVPHDAPRLEVPGRGLGLAGAAVVELDGRPVLGGLPEHVEGRLVGGRAAARRRRGRTRRPARRPP